ncbi:MAG: transcriptional regulator [Elusimicrobia bacterium]|nr:transcriptional regulator [Elusimicrobiota bacterium]
MSFIVPDQLDPVIHERVRLGIVSALAAAAELSFTELREMLKVTDGNLSVHSRLLEEAGYVSIAKAFVERRPRTTLALTQKGRMAFQGYISALESLVKPQRK